MYKPDINTDVNGRHSQLVEVKSKITDKTDKVSIQERLIMKK